MNEWDISERIPTFPRDGKWEILVEGGKVGIKGPRKSWWDGRLDFKIVLSLWMASGKFW